MAKLNWVSTVVGSFPRENTPENMEKSFKDQIDAGIDYPCYPQLVSMIDQFLDPLAADPDSGLVKKGDKFYLENELKIPKEPVATEYGKFVLDYFKKYPEDKSKVKGWKACLTGPFTLAGEIHIPPEMFHGKRIMVYKEPRAIMNGDIVSKLAEFMANNARAYNEMGANIISMDEPTLALIVGRRKAFFHKEDEIIQLLNKAIEPIKSNSSLHVCGNVAPKLRDILLNSNVNIMDHEFANGSNPELFEKAMFDREDKTLAYGVLESNVQAKEGAGLNDYVESGEIIKKRIQTAVNLVGTENVMFKPDCGFGGLLATFGEELGSNIVKNKLNNLQKAMKSF